LNETDRREPLFQHLDAVLKVAREKYKTDNRENSERIKWGNLIIKAVHEYGFLLKSEDTEIRLTELEEKLKHGVLIPDGNEQTTKRLRR